MSPPEFFNPPPQTAFGCQKFAPSLVFDLFAITNIVVQFFDLSPNFFFRFGV